MPVTPSRPHLLMMLLCLIASFTISCATAGRPVGAGRDNPPALNALLDAVDVRVARLQRALRETAQSAVVNGPDGQATRTFAASQFKDIPAMIYIFDQSGAIVNQLGTSGAADLPWDAVPHVSGRGGMFGSTQLLPDGAPVIDARFERDGITVVARVYTQPFLESAVEQILGGTNIDSWIMEPDGLQVYEPDPEEVGKNLLTDPMYKDYSRLLNLAGEMRDKPWGTGTYDFLDTGFQTIVEKRATWDTLDFPGVNWRIVMVQLQLKGQDVIFPDDSDVIFEARAMKAAVRKEPTLTEFRNGNEAGIRTFFKDFLAKNEGIYNLAHITKEGVIVYGEPREHSFDDYDLNAGRRDNDIVLLEATRSENDTWLVFDLAEGDKGLFHVTPLWDGTTHLGAVYTIWVLPE